MIDFGLWYDFRNPPGSAASLKDVYAETIEQVVFAEQLGFDHVWTTEHHFVVDGYSPSLLPICAAVAARTRRVRVGTAVLLLLLHDPIRIAEDAATVDLISGGRLDLGVGIGYRQPEFAAFHVRERTRGRQFEEAIAVLRQALGPGPVDFRGQFYQYEGLDVTPKPIQQPLPLWLGGLTAPAVSRAARLGDGFLAGAGEDFIPAFLAERASRGQATPPIWASIGFVAVARDPDGMLARIAPHVIYQRRIYARWLQQAGTPIWDVPESANDLRRSDPDLVVTPARAREIIAQRLAGQPALTHLSWAPVPPGLGPHEATASLELFAAEVMPHFRGGGEATEHDVRT
ncbi:LLM class flavin-dependent oxidoreductase [bacterium]|nr:LLM class flavin-dependent oxidoreductase [bacterium]